MIAEGEDVAELGLYFAEDVDQALAISAPDLQQMANWALKITRPPSSMLHGSTPCITIASSDAVYPHLGTISTVL
ncbi:hypothetical protein FOMA001_g16840 [Fusarium oxysporum f. sp. matthiolae]|nr:hypothetical protein FOMA001_g16840 [Fusarium oxysporum f. sp. matthiolae]